MTDADVVTTKVPGRHHGHDDAISSDHGSMEQLDHDYIDLHLILLAQPERGQAQRGPARTRRPPRAGPGPVDPVSNFTEAHLTRVVEERPLARPTALWSLLW